MGKKKEKYKIVYPALEKWFIENDMNIKKFCTECCNLSTACVAFTLYGFTDPYTSTIDEILKATGMTYAEAFSMI